MYGICFRKIIVYYFCSQKCIYFFCDQNSLGFSQVQYSCENSIGWQALLQFLWNVKSTHYSLLGHFQKFPSRVRVGQKIPSSIRVAGTRWGLPMLDPCLRQSTWALSAQASGILAAPSVSTPNPFLYLFSDRNPGQVNVFPKLCLPPFCCCWETIPDNCAVHQISTSEVKYPGKFCSLCCWLLGLPPWCCLCIISNISGRAQVFFIPSFQSERNPLSCAGPGCTRLSTGGRRWPI